MSDPGNTAPAGPETQPAANPAWYRPVGIGMVVFSALLAVAALVHLAGRTAFIGIGAWKPAISPLEIWQGYQQGSPSVTAIFVAEQCGGFLSTWLTYLALGLGLAVWGLSKIGHKQSWSLFEGIAVSIFSLLVVFLGSISCVSGMNQSIAFLGLPLTAVVLPAVCTGIAMLVVGIRQSIFLSRELFAQKPAAASKAKPAKAKAKASSAKSTPVRKVVVTPSSSRPSPKKGGRQ